jgi:hypothetical protein
LNPVVWYKLTNVSEVLAAFIIGAMSAMNDGLLFIHRPENGGNKHFKNVGKLLLPNNPEDGDHTRRENLKSH